MTASFRAGLRAALAVALVVVATAAFAADKIFQNSELDDAAIKLEAQIKTDAGAVTRSPAQLSNFASTWMG